MSAPVQAKAIAGQVIIAVDPSTARDLAEAFATAYATCEELEQDRPRWFDDVVEITSAAARADIQNGNAPAAVMVPLVDPASFPVPLRLVGGESA